MGEGEGYGYITVRWTISVDETECMEDGVAEIAGDGEGGEGAEGGLEIHQVRS